MEELQGSSFDLSDNFIDPLLSPEINCTGWHKSITSEEANREAELFKESNYMKETLHEVSKRLGFGYDLTFDAVYDIYSICSFDKAWYYKSVSPWCAAFTPYHLKVLEYYEDLYYYYRSGYGNPNAARLGCHLVQDLIYKFDNMTNRNGTIDVPPISLFFTHSVMLRAVLTRLGIAKDIMPPTHINFNPSTTTRRQWRTSIISPFAGNLAVVLYRCQNSKYKVMFYLNEQIIDYAGCKVGLCDWSYIYNSFAELVNPSICNLDFCYQTGSSIKITFTLWTFILTAYTVLL
ncbi:hypothetical protein O3M35_006145 [Rhynocoris fuscipes]|uniref:Multiple inositol polyphosphate phosphatase 1 n=1 Tax=Rhynocoris fuscipes TaxID=488301 RepID=A0AAW1DCA2_9HEMI